MNESGPSFQVDRTPEGHVSFSVPVSAFDWSKIVELLKQYGPQILQLILQMISKK